MTHREEVDIYVASILSDRKVACKELKQACERWLQDLKNPAYELRESEAEYIIKIIENTMKFIMGEDADGRPFRGRPFLLQPWQKFIIFNICGFFNAGTDIRRYDEAFIFIPRKNGKTMFVAALAWALACRHAASGSRLFLSSASLRQSLLSFNLIKENLEMLGILDSLRVRDNNQEHSIGGRIGEGSIDIQAFAGTEKFKDGLNCSICIADEIHAYKDPTQYNVFRESMKAYRNKLMIAITTAGDDTTSFCYQRLKTCQAILAGTVRNERYFIFICKADESENGEVDFTNPIEHEKANPNYGITVMPSDLIASAEMASAEPQQRKDFLAKELNIYTASLKAYFDVEVFQKSDRLHDWTLEELAQLPVVWFGGVDLSKIKDLTAAVLYTEYNGIDIVIPHAWFPVTRAIEKAEQDNIPLFGWMDDGWLTMCNEPTINSIDVALWFEQMRTAGFKIEEVRYDVRFGQEFVEEMRHLRFKIENQPQLYTKTTVGFNRIDKAAENGTLYYCHSDAFEYCVQNVMAHERPGGFRQFEKINPNMRIDIFAAAVFAATGMMEKAAGIARKARILRK